MKIYVKSSDYESGNDKSGILVTENSNGKIVDYPKDHIFEIQRGGTRDYDGLLDTYVYKSSVDYATGLVQTEQVTGHNAFYMNKCKGDKEFALKYATMLLGGN